MKRIGELTDLGNPDSVASRSREGRWQKFVSIFDGVQEMSVLDLGGTPDYWQSAPVRPARVTVVNVASHDSTDAVRCVVADACALPHWLKATKFDLVVSNSLLEHVGGHAQRQRLADAVVDLAPKYWIQTPYRYFPMEPHWLFPGFQFLPVACRVMITRYWRSGPRYESDALAALRSVNEVDLVSISQLRGYFPDATIWKERVAGLVKSLVAIRT